MSEFHETPVTTVMHTVMREAMDIIGTERPIDPAERVRQHILDRWYRFEPFGVASRADLAAIKVTVTEAPGGPPMDWDALNLRLRSRTSVSFVGTKLEGKLA